MADAFSSTLEKLPFNKDKIEVIKSGLVNGLSVLISSLTF